MAQEDAGSGRRNLILEWQRRGADPASASRKRLTAGASIVIGRDPACGVVLADPGVSRTHARLEVGAAHVRVHNLSRSKTTRIGDQPIAVGEWRPGQRMTIAGFDFLLREGPREAQARPPAAMPHARQPLRERALPQPASAPAIRLRWQSTRRGDAPNGAQMILRGGASVTIGKNPGCDIALRDPLVSGEHARIEVGAQGVRITDLGSTNGTVLGGEQIKQASWRSGQTLEIGSHVFSIDALSPRNEHDEHLTRAFLGQAPTGATTSAWRLRVFISYSRKDQAQADRLAAALQKSGFYVWIDRRLPYGEEWKREITASIQGSDTVVFLVSPDSVASDWCQWELEHVRNFGKRLFPIKIRDIPLDRLPRVIQNVQILPGVGSFDFDRDYPQLVKALQTDQGWNREHTRLLVQAMAWHAQGRPSAMLLRGVELSNAQQWAKARPHKATVAPQITEYIAFSRKGQIRRWIAGNSTLLAIICAVAIGVWKYEQLLDLGNRARIALTSYWTRNVAEKDKEIERLRRQIAQLEQFRSEFYGRLSRALGGLGVREVGDRFVVPAGVLFDSGQATLTAEGREALGRIPSLIQELEHDRAAVGINWVLQVNGHTDKRPISTSQFPSNLELSTARATTVVRYLVDRGVRPARLVAAGYGDTQLLEKGETDLDHRQNRRIELKLTDR